MRKLLVGAVIAGAFVIGVDVGASSAAQPAAQGCVGETISANAHAFHPYGQAVLVPNTPRNFFGTVGDAVNAVQAGQVPDEVFPNTCN